MSVDYFKEKVVVSWWVTLKPMDHTIALYEHPASRALIIISNNNLTVKRVM